MVSAEALTIRQAHDDDLPQILRLLSVSLGWRSDERDADFFRWKHTGNAFGPSLSWVAADGDRIVGLRAWMRWRFTRGGDIWDAVRGVDTATDPEYQRRGIFRSLTLSSLEALREHSIGHVFNTPNDNSRPGYLKMGWEAVGPLPVSVRFRSPRAALQALRSRATASAEKWSIPTDIAAPALEVLADDAAIGALVGSRPDDGRIRTDFDADVLRWRYGFGPLCYRGLASDDGIVLFRLRRRGAAVECVVGEMLAPSVKAERRLVSAVARVTRADQLLRITDDPRQLAGEFPLPGGGPVLTWRSITHEQMPVLADWKLSMGDIELF